jgi:hypothetical protein
LVTSWLWHKARQQIAARHRVTKAQGITLALTRGHKRQRIRMTPVMTKPMSQVGGFFMASVSIRKIFRRVRYVVFEQTGAAGNAVAQDLAQHVQGLDQAMIVQAIGHAHTLALGLHKPTLAQNFEMAGGGRLWDADFGCQLIVGPRLFSQGIQDEDAAGVT